MTDRKLSKQEEIRREIRRRDLLEQRQLQAAVRAIRARLRAHDKDVRAKRVGWQKAMGQVPRMAGAKLRLGAAQRKERLAHVKEAYRAWWKKIQRERAQRLAQIAEIRGELAAFRRGMKAALVDAVDRIHSQLTDAREVEKAGDAGMRAELEVAVTAAIQLAREKAHENRFSSYRAPKPASRKAAGKKRAESRSELLDAIRSNLSPSELIRWKRYERQVMAEARKRGAASPERHVEVFRELVESHPEDEGRFEQEAADAWVAEEIRRHHLQAT